MEGRKIKQGQKEGASGEWVGQGEQREIREKGGEADRKGDREEDRHIERQHFYKEDRIYKVSASQESPAYYVLASTSRSPDSGLATCLCIKQVPNPFFPKQNPSKSKAYENRNKF